MKRTTFSRVVLAAAVGAALPGCLLTRATHERFLGSEHWTDEIVGCSVSEQNGQVRVAFVDQHNDEPWRYEASGAAPAAGAAPKVLRPTDRDRGAPLPPSAMPCVVEDSFASTTKQWTPDPRLDGAARHFDAAGRAEAANRKIDGAAAAHAAVVVRDLQWHGEHQVRLRVFLPPAEGRGGERPFEHDRVADFALEAPGWRGRVAAYVFVVPFAALADLIGAPVEGIIMLVLMIKTSRLD